MSLKEFDVSGQKVLITGAGRGIGKGIALAFAEAGCDVAITGITTTGVNKVAGEVRALGRQALPLSGDATLYRAQAPDAPLCDRNVLELIYRCVDHKDALVVQLRVDRKQKESLRVGVVGHGKTFNDFAIIERDAQLCTARAWLGLRLKIIGHALEIVYNEQRLELLDPDVYEFVTLRGIGACEVKGRVAGKEIVRRPFHHAPVAKACYAFDCSGHVVVSPAAECSL